tara:strand:- start:46 stop:933 length:888 start_codon:yes stop_codon:yes gene_type:complete
MSHICDTPIPPKQIHLSTRHASGSLAGGKMSDVIWFLNDAIVIPNNVEILLSMETIQIPHSIHTFNTLNNTIKYSIGSVEFTENITVGNYQNTAFSKGEVINSLTGQPLGHNNFTFTLIPHQHKFKITASAAVTITSDWGLLGFSIGQTGTEITATRCYDLNGLSSLLLSSNFAVSNIDSIDTGVNNSILARVPITTAPGGTIFYQKTNEYQIVLQAHSIHRVNLRLTDDDLNLVNLNGLDWHITLNLMFRYIPDMIRPSSLDDLMHIQRQLTLHELNAHTKEAQKKASKKKRSK